MHPVKYAFRLFALFTMVRDRHVRSLHGNNRLRPAIIFAVLTFLSPLLIGCSETVVVVNGEEVSKKAVEQELKARGSLHKSGNIHVSDELMKKSALSAVINRVILLQEAEKRGVTVTQGELKNALDTFREKVGGEMGLRDYLKNTDMSRRDLIRRLRDERTIEKLYQSIYNSVSIQEEELVKYYRSRNWKSLGPIKVRIDYVEIDSREKAKKVEQEIKDYYYNGVLKRLTSEKRPGIRVRKPFWIYPDKYDQEFVKAIKDMTIGEPRGPVKIRDKWYFIRVSGREAEMPAFDEAKDGLREEMRKERARKELGAVIEKNFNEENVKIVSNEF